MERDYEALFNESVRMLGELGTALAEAKEESGRWVKRVKELEAQLQRVREVVR